MFRLRLAAVRGLHATLNGSHHQLANDRRDTIDLAPGHANNAIQHLAQAIQLCRDYSMIRPDRARRTVHDDGVVVVRS